MARAQNAHDGSSSEGEEVPAARPRTVALVGPRPDSRGGVGATLRVIAESVVGDRYRIVVVPTYRDGSRSKKVLQAATGLACLARLVARGKVDLVHLHSSWGASFTRKAVALAIARAGRRPVVLHMHGGAFHDELARPGWRGVIRRHALRWALERADAVVALTPGWARELGSWAGVRRLHVVPNAPDLSVPVERNGRASPPPSTILFLGHLYREKGVFELVDAVAQIRASRPDLRLVLAGDRALAARLVEAGRRRAREQYTAQVVAKRVEAIYDELLETE